MSLKLAENNICKIWYGSDEVCKAWLGSRQIYGCNLPPKVSGISRDYFGGTYQFVLGDFTNEFSDPNNDSYKNTTIETVPLVGHLEYEGQQVGVGFEFDLLNIGNLEYIFPDNYQLSRNGYCIFDQSISQIISDKESEGFTLVRRESGLLRFEKEVYEGIPNDTDIYAFFDTTSMKTSDAQAASNALNTWFTDYKNNNQDYVGNLYIIPIFYERWVDYQDVIKNGTGYGKINDLVAINPPGGNACKQSAHVNTGTFDWVNNIAVFPPNFDYTTDNPTNGSWVPPSKVLSLCFVDESQPEYHENRSSYGFRSQPTNNYLTDYKRFRDNIQETFEFFKGVFYPIANITSNNYDNIYNACVLQGFSAIEGGSTYTTAEMEALGVDRAGEGFRNFNRYLDVNDPNYIGSDPKVANPYSPEAETPVPGAGYNLQGLKDFGWSGYYDKNQPASEVFDSGSFSEELSSFLQGDQIYNTEIYIEEGECFTSTGICFSFKTSDDSSDLLYSNVANFCLNIKTGETSPTVSDNSALLITNEYLFKIGDFTKNFSDPEGDSYHSLILTSLPSIGNLSYLGAEVSVDDILLIDNIGGLKFSLPDNYYVYNGVLYNLKISFEELIQKYEEQGYYFSGIVGDKITFSRSNYSDIVVVATRSEDNISIGFQVTDDSEFRNESNNALFTLIPEGEINIPETTENQPPIIGDNLVKVELGGTYAYDLADFTTRTNPNYSDPEDDDMYQLKVVALPPIGKLQLRGVDVIEGQILFAETDIATGDFTYVSDPNYLITYTEFEYEISDFGSKKFSS